MHCVERLAVAAAVLLALGPASAQEAVRLADPGAFPAGACLDQNERRAAAEIEKLVPLAAAMRAARKRMPGVVVRARLCRSNDGLVYVLTVLARDGKVARLTIDALRGTLVGMR